MAVVVVGGLVVVVVLRVCHQDPLALRRDLRVGHHLQPLGLQGLVDNGGGLWAGWDGDRGRGVPRPRIGLAGGGGGLLGPDGGALGDGDVDEALDGVVAASLVAVCVGGRGACGAVGVGPCWQGRFCRCCCCTFCDCWGCVWWCWSFWWWCCCGWRCCWRWGSGCGFRWGLGSGTGSRWRRTLSRRFGGTAAGQGGFSCCCRCAGVARMAVGGPPAALFAAAGLALAVALWMRLAGRGEKEVEDDEEDEDEEEVVVLRDAGCAAMWAGAALRAVVVSAAATGGRIEAISSGIGFRAGGWRAPAAIRRPGGPIWSAAVCGGGVGLRSPPSGFRWAGLLQFGRVCVSAYAEGNSLRGLHLGAGGVGPGVTGLCVGGVCGSLGGMGVPWGMGLFAAVPVVCRVWGAARLA